MAKGKTASKTTKVKVDSNQPLRTPHSCSECKARITTQKDLQVVVALVNGKRRKQSRCPQHRVAVSAAK